MFQRSLLPLVLNQPLLQGKCSSVHPVSVSELTACCWEWGRLSLLRQTAVDLSLMNARALWACLGSCVLRPECLESTCSSDSSVVMFVVTGSSTDISEDWEKDFDLDMTEEEVQLALSKVEVSGEVSRGGGAHSNRQEGCSQKPSATPWGDAARVLLLASASPGR